MYRQLRVFLFIVLALAAIAVPSLASASPVLNVDFGVSDDPEIGFSANRVQPQFSDFAISDHLNSSIYGDLAAILPPATSTQSFGGISVTITGICACNGLFFYDIGTVADELGPLSEDFVGPSGLDLELVVGGLEAGRYMMTSYHHHSGREATFLMPAITVDDAMGNRVVAEDIPISFGLNPTQVSSAEFEITGDGSGNVLVLFEGDSYATSVAVLNGFSIVRVPEPSALALVVLAVAGLCVSRFRAVTTVPV